MQNGSAQGQVLAQIRSSTEAQLRRWVRKSYLPMADEAEQEPFLVSRERDCIHHHGGRCQCSLQTLEGRIVLPPT